MKGKRILAALVCMAMIMTSGSFTTSVFAQEVQDQSVLTVEAGEQIVPSDQEQPEVTVDIEEADPADEDAPIPAEPESEPVQDETDAPADGGNAEEMQEIPIDADELLTEEEQTDVDEPEEPEEFGEDAELLGARPTQVSDLFDPSSSTLAWAEGTAPTSVDECVLLPEGITDIEAGIFNEGVGRNIKEVYFSDNLLASIGDEAFKNSNIEVVALTGNNVTIGSNAFDGCNKLKTINLKKVTEIGAHAFRVCTSLAKADLSNAETVGEGAFQDCSQLTSITWGTDLYSIGKDAFRGCAMDTLNLTDLYLLIGDPDAVPALPAIGEFAFADNVKLKNVSLPIVLPEIAPGLFSGCSALTTFTMDKVTSSMNATASIGAEAFKGCVKLAKIAIGYHVAYVGNKAFDDCTILNDIKFYHPTGNVEIATDAFTVITGNRKAIIYGYNGKVKEYAESGRGYIYKYLGEEYKVNPYNKPEGSVSPNVQTAYAGTKILLTVVPAKGYALTGIRVKYKDESGSDAYMDYKPVPDTTGELQLESCSPAKQVFSFYMPASDTNFVPTYVKTTDLFKNGKPAWEFVEPTWGATGEVLNMPTSGKYTFIQLKDSKTGAPIGPWNFNMSYDPADKPVATINEFGKIVGVREGTATVTLIAAADKTKKISISVHVGASADIGLLRFDDYFEHTWIEDALIRRPNIGLEPDDPEYDPFADSRYYVVEYNMEDLAKVDHTFTPQLEAYATEDVDFTTTPPEVADGAESHLVHTYWTTSDKTIVLQKTPQTSENENLITVKKGTYGEVFMRVRHEKTDGSVIETGFIVRVVDIAPRLNTKKPEINTNNKAGIILPLDMVYDYKLLTGATVSLKVVTKTVKNGTITWHDDTLPASAFTAYYDDDGNMRLKADAKALGIAEDKDKTYQNLYIEGKLYRGEDKSRPYVFHMLIPEVYVLNCKLKAKLSYTGRINLLYNDEYEKADSNVVQVYHNVQNTRYFNIKSVDDIKLVSEANHKKLNSEVPDKLAKNFVVEKLLYDRAGRASGFVVKVAPGITLDKQFEKLNGKIVTTGYAEIKFDGYNDPVVVPIAIPCGYTYPTYALSMTKVTTSSAHFVNPAYDIQLVDTSKGRKGVDLYEADDEGIDPKTEVPADYDGPAKRKFKVAELYNDTIATDLLYNEPKGGGWEVATNADKETLRDEDDKPLFKDYIHISYRTRVSTNAKERFALRMEEWRLPMMFDFTMVPYAKAITAKCTPAAVTVNKAVTEQTAEMKVGYNLPAVITVSYSAPKYVKPTRARKEVLDTGEALEGAITVDITDENPVIKVNIGDLDPEDLWPGRYTFQTTPKIKFGETTLDEKAFALEPVKFSITVTEKNPVLSLKKSTFSLNTEYAAGGEIAKSATSVANLVKGAEYEIDASDVHCVAVPKKNYPEPWTGEDVTVTTDPVTKKKEYSFDGGTWSDAFEFTELPDDNGNNTILGISLKEMDYPITGNYDYFLYGLKYSIKGGSIEHENARPLRIRIACQYMKKPTVTLTGRGGYNQVISSKVHPDPDVKTDVPGYEIVYHYKMKNLNGTIDDLKLIETDNRNSQFYVNGYDEYWSPHFEYELTWDSVKKEQTITLRLNRDLIMGHDPEAEIPGDPYEGLDIEPLRNGQPHKLVLYYHIPEMGDADDDNSWGTYRMSLTPKQILPALQQVGTESGIYAGKPEEERIFTMQVGKTSCQTAVFCGVKMITEDGEPADPENPQDTDRPTNDTLKETNYVKIADSAPENVRKAFMVTEVQQYKIEDGEIVYDDDGNPIPIFLTDLNGNYILDKAKHKIPCARITVKMVQPSLLVGGKTYTVPIEIRYVNQAKETAGTVVNYKVTVRK